MNRLSQYETTPLLRKFPHKLLSKLFLCSLTFLPPNFFLNFANAYEGSGDLRDSCRSHFAAARQSEAQLEALKNAPLRMVRIGGELDVALYDRLAQVRRQRIAAASVSVRTAQSALSGCLAKQLSVQQSQRMPANVVVQPYVNQAQSSSIAPSTLVNSPQVREQVYISPPRVPKKKCDPETEEFGCPIEPIRVGQ